MGWNGVVPAELEFAAAQQLLGRHGGDALFEQPIGAWFTAAERESFQGDSLRSLGNLLLSSFSDASASVGNDDASIAILISVIQRACGDLARSVPAAEPDPVEEPSRQPSVRGSGARSKFALRAAEHHAVRQDPLPWIPAGLWAGWCWTVNVNRLDHFPLGFFARSLRNLPPRMWNVPVGVYSRRSLRQLLDVNGVGEGTLVPVVKIIADLARTLDCVPTESQARLLIMPAAVLQATAWLRRRFPPGRAPRATAIATGLIRPLLAQLDLDLGPEIQRNGGTPDRFGRGSSNGRRGCRSLRSFRFARLAKSQAGGSCLPGSLAGREVRRRAFLPFPSGGKRRGGAIGPGLENDRNSL